MFGTPKPLVDPLTIEIVNHTEWWQPYIPPLVGLLGSIIVAAVAFIGVRMSNNTNHKAITSADERERDRWKTDSDREREKWHRDNLLRICSEAVRVSREIIQHYNEAAGVSLKLANPDDFDSAFWEHIAAAETAIGKVAPLSYDMQLLGELELAADFQEVRMVGEFVRPAFVQYHRYLVDNFAYIRAARKEGGQALKNVTAETQASLAFRRYSKASEHLSRAAIDLQFAAQRKISPGSIPESKLPKSVELDLPAMPPSMSGSNPFRRPSPLDWNAGDTADRDEAPKTAADD